MREKFNNSVLQLNNNQYAGIAIESKDPMGNFNCMKFTDEAGATSTTATKTNLTARYGSVEAFFEYLFKNGINDLRITDRKRNGGNAWKKIGEPYEINLSSPNEVEQQLVHRAMHFQTTQELQPVQQVHQAIPLQGSQPYGLSGADNYKVWNHDVLKDLCTKQEAKIERLTEENQRLKDENLKHELLGTKSVEKAQSQNELLGILAPIIAPIVQAKMGGNAQSVGGLSGADLSPVKQAFATMINHADDGFVQDLAIVAKAMTNESFDAELTELLKKHNLTN